MELFQVRYFLALAKTLNFTRAAEQCNVSQPALTRAIQHLEEELGGPLLYRERSLTQLTELGKTMLPHLEATYAAARAATEQASAFKKRALAPLRIGLNQTISADVLTPILQELQGRIKGFELSLEEGTSDELFGRILNGDVDAGIIVEQDKIPERLNRWPMFEDRYVVLCSTEHPFAQMEAVGVRALANECVLVRSKSGLDFEFALDRLCIAAGIKPRSRHTGSNEDQVQNMVRAGLGVAISSAHRPTLPGVVACPLANDEAIRRVFAVAAAGRQLGPGVALFLKLLRARDWGDIGRSVAGSVQPSSIP